MIVAQIGNFSHPWCSEVHFAKSLREVGHHVAQLQENALNWRTLPAIVKKRRAEAVLWTRTWAVDTDACLWALGELRRMGVPTGSYHLDRWWGLDREYQVASEPFFRTDIVFSPDGGSDDKWLTAGVNHVWSPPGVYAAECGVVPPDLGRFPHEVVFVGSHPYPHAEWEPYRSELIGRLADRYGERFAVWPQPRQPIRGMALQTLYASARVVVGDSCLVRNPVGYWSDRIPETLGRGGALVHPYVKGLADWYTPDEHLACYVLGDFDGLLAKVDHMLAHPEETRAMGERARTLVLSRDTYAHRMAFALSKLAEVHRTTPTVEVPKPETTPTPTLTIDLRDAGPLRVRHRLGVHATFRPDPAENDCETIREVWSDDTYKLEADWFRRGKLVVDVGANVGAFSVLAARLGARVVAFEPHPETLERLRRNVAANGVSVDVRPLAVSGPATFESMFVGSGGGAHMVHDAESVYIGDPMRSVRTVSLDQIVAELGPVDLLKVDVEGAEYEIIAVCDDETLHQIRRAVFEFHGPAMPHLSYLGGAEDFGPFVAKLAQQGRVRTFGRPSHGGILWYEAY